jgi:hypothetical protein
MQYLLRKKTCCLFYLRRAFGLYRFRVAPETSCSRSELPEPLPLYKPRCQLPENKEPGHLVPASTCSNYPAYGGLPPPSQLVSRPPSASGSGAGGSGSGDVGPVGTAVSPSYPRVSSTTHSDNEREGDIGKNYVVLSHSNSSPDLLRILPGGFYTHLNKIACSGKYSPLRTLPILLNCVPHIHEEP